MLTFEIGETRIIHHSDFSGNCEITNTQTNQKVSVPCEVLLAFVAEFVRTEKITKLEQMDNRTILGLNPIGINEELFAKFNKGDLLETIDSYNHKFGVYFIRYEKGKFYGLHQHTLIPVIAPISSIKSLKLITPNDGKILNTKEFKYAETF